MVQPSRRRPPTMRVARIRMRRLNQILSAPNPAVVVPPKMAEARQRMREILNGKRSKEEVVQAAMDLWHEQLKRKRAYHTNLNALVRDYTRLYDFYVHYAKNTKQLELVKKLQTQRNMHKELEPVSKRNLDRLIFAYKEFRKQFGQIDGLPEKLREELVNHYIEFIRKNPDVVFLNDK